MTYRIEESEEVLTLTIDRPDIRSVINAKVMDGFEKFITAVQESEGRRAVMTEGG